MENTESPKRAAKRIRKKQSEQSSGRNSSNTIGLDDDAFNQLESRTGKKGMSKVKFASAAIRYFTERGLDPTQATSIAEGVQTRTKVSEESFAIRKQNANIGNRLVVIMRERDATLYKLLQEQHASVISYLEQIETNILTHQVTVETQVLSTLLERVVRNGVEVAANRSMLEVLTLQSKAEPPSAQELKISNANYDVRRNHHLLLELQKLKEKVIVAAPKPTSRPAFPAPATDAPCRSTAPTTTTTPPKL